MWPLLQEGGCEKSESPEKKLGASFGVQKVIETYLKKQPAKICSEKKRLKGNMSGRGTAQVTDTAKERPRGRSG